MTIPNKELQGHRPELDGIRGLAILAGLCSHGVGVTGNFSPQRIRSLPSSLTNSAEEPQ